jgi:hypothetical protein
MRNTSLSTTLLWRASSETLSCHEADALNKSSFFLVLATFCMTLARARALLAFVSQVAHDLKSSKFFILMATLLMMLLSSRLLMKHAFHVAHDLNSSKFFILMRILRVVCAIFLRYRIRSDHEMNARADTILIHLLMTLAAFAKERCCVTRRCQVTKALKIPPERHR